VKDTECVEFLRWALPCLQLRWAGFRKVRRQVCRRLERRIGDLELSGVDAYREYLESTPDEWPQLDALCRVTISRFYRDRGVFEFLEGRVLPELAEVAAAGEGTVEAWSAGCGSGEEPYTLALVWEHAIRPAFPTVTLRVLASDADETMVRRARAAAYGESSLRDLPTTLRRHGLVRRVDRFHVRPRLRELVTVVEHDVRDPPPDGPFDLVLCRNLAFTYFDLSLQRDVSRQLAGALRQGGALVIGSHETLPEGAHGFVAWCSRLGVYRRAA
jgi:chemotaxis protein methyltransferase CheR